MPNIVVADFFPSGYTQRTTALIEDIVISSRKSQTSETSAVDFICRDVALRALSLVTACFMTCANMVMALPMYVVAIAKCIYNRHDSPELIKGILKISFYTAGIIGLGIAIPLLSAMISPDLLYRNDGVRVDKDAAGGVLRLVDDCNMGLFLETIQDPQFIRENRPNPYMEGVFGISTQHVAAFLQSSGWRDATLEQYHEISRTFSREEALCEARSFFDEESIEFMVLVTMTATCRA